MLAVFIRLVGRLNHRTAGHASFVGLVLMLGAVVVMLSVADWRLSLAPWLLGSAVLCFAFCCSGVLRVHLPEPRRSVTFGVILTVVSLLALASFPLAVGIGGVLGIDEESAGVFAALPLLASGFGLIAMTPGLAATAVGAGTSGVVPRWGVWALWAEAPLLPLTAIAGGIAEPAAVIGFTLLPVGWVVIGAALLSAKPAAAPAT